MAGRIESYCHYAQAGQLVRVVADGLAGHGFEACEPVREESQRIRITIREHWECEVTINDYGCVILYYSPPGKQAAEPTLITNLVMTPLGHTRNGRESRYAGLAAGLPLRCIVGRALKFSGYEVRLDVYKDDDYFDICPELVITNPADPGRGLVRLDDDGGLVWERCYCHAAAEKVDPGEIVSDLAAVMTQAAALK